jgi:hypothetical protein
MDESVLRNVSKKYSSAQQLFVLRKVSDSLHFTHHIEASLMYDLDSEIRRQNLIKLIRPDGASAAISKLCGNKPHVQHISNVKNSVVRKSDGRITRLSAAHARHMEKELGLRRFWFDVEHQTPNWVIDGALEIEKALDLPRGFYDRLGGRYGGAFTQP